MIHLLVLLLLFAWGMCSLVAYGIMFAALQGGESQDLAPRDHRSDERWSLLFAAAGPFGLAGALAASGGGKYGIRFS